jgi:glycosyltransferase involved in cell wall biosynthesis
MLPLVSIITPAYNRASYLDETIQSVLRQDYPDIEYIVLDDGSTDNTREVLEKYTGRVIWETHTNMGEACTVNKGFYMAHGEIMAVVNSDDPLLPGAISAIVERMRADPELIVVYPDWNMIDESGKLIQHIATFNYSYRDMLRWHHCIPGPGTFFRCEVVYNLRGRDSQFRYVGDFDFWLRAGLIGPFARIPKTLACFRWHAGGESSSAQGIKMAEEHIRLVEKVYSIPNLPKDLLSIKREAYSSAYYIAGVVCGNKLTEMRKKYYVRAITRCPRKYPFEYRERSLVILREFAGPFYHFSSLLVAFIGKLKHLIISFFRD